MSCIGGGIDKSFAEIATSAITNVDPADAVVNTAFSGVSDGILRAFDASPGRPIVGSDV